ncbi:hypothetical protein Tco_0911599 [Tanacetum coccineum]|uniref:Uncharacterized protein n=1 Tax=Tanacetum coccineum TaxID=301880 RepID=A0ABQ5CX39_9ASTR
MILIFMIHDVEKKQRETRKWILDTTEGSNRSTCNLSSLCVHSLFSSFVRRVTGAVTGSGQTFGLPSSASLLSATSTPHPTIDSLNIITPAASTPQPTPPWLPSRQHLRTTTLSTTTSPSSPSPSSSNPTHHVTATATTTPRSSPTSTEHHDHNRAPAGVRSVLITPQGVCYGCSKTTTRVRLAFLSAPRSLHFGNLWFYDFGGFSRVEERQNGTLMRLISIASLEELQCEVCALPRIIYGSRSVLSQVELDAGLLDVATESKSDKIHLWISY